jgi:predicted ATPase
MLKFWFKGFKRFSDWTEFELKPITVLTGTNNSGKSSITQLLNILYESFKNSYLPNFILNTSTYKLGSENDIYNYDDKEGKFQIVFKPEVDEKSIICFEYIKEDGKKPYLVLNTVSYYIYDDTLEPILSLDRKKSKIYFNQSQLLFYLHKAGASINDFYESEYEAIRREKIDEIEREVEFLEIELKDHLESGGKKEDDEYKERENKLIDKKKKIEEIKNWHFKSKKIKTYNRINDFSKKLEAIDSQKFELFADETFIDFFWIRETNEDNEENVENITEYIRENWTLTEYVDYLIFVSKQIFYLLDDFFQDIQVIEKKVKKLQLNYSSSLMKLRKRAFGEFDQHLKYLKLIEKYTDEYKESINEKFNDCMKIFDDEIEYKLDVDVFEGVFYKLLINNQNVANFGDGFKNLISIILPIILEEIEKNEQQNFIIEEPEIRLHPKMQSLLADLFKELSKTHNFIIETHSEYMIRKFQILIANGELDKDNIRIYYIENSGKIRNMIVNENGSIKQNFGKGFFDESASLTIELLKKQSENV